MESRSFEGIGTQWEIRVDTEKDIDELFVVITQHIELFDQQLSRFIPTSEVSELFKKGAGTYSVSTKLAMLLETGKTLEKRTAGNFNLAIGNMLEKTGYNAEYSFASAPEKITPEIFPWEIHKNSVTLHGPTLFDIGSIGKGLLIDEVAAIISQHGYKHYLVDAGGDIFATSKSSGQGWKIALEWPGKPELALGTVELSNQGFAASDVYKRTWKNWNHLVSAKTGRSLTHMLGCIALADSAFLADQMTSSLSFSPDKNYTKVREDLGGEYVVLLADQSAHISPQWPGTFF